MGPPYSRVVGQPNPNASLNFMQPYGHLSGDGHSIDELLGLSSGGRSTAAIPPLVPPPLPHSGLVSAHQSRQSSADDSSDAANQLLYALLVSSGGLRSEPSPAMSTSLPFQLDSLSSAGHQSSPSVQTRFESQIRSIANDIQQTIQLHMNGLQMRKEQLLKQLEHIKQTYQLVLTTQTHSQASGHHPGHHDLQLPSITFTRPDSALYKAVTTLGFLTTPALAVNCSATGDGVETAMEGEATCFTITTRNCFNEELLIGGEHLDIEILVTDQNALSLSASLTVPHSLLDHNNGKYTVTYTIPRGLKLGQPVVHVSVAVNGLPIQSSPFLVSMVSQRTRNAWKRIASFGSHITQTYQLVLTTQTHSQAGGHHPGHHDLQLPTITFTRQDSALYKAVTTLGIPTTLALAINCSATGDGVETAMEGEATCFTITTRNCFNEELLIGGEHLDIEILVTDQNALSLSASLTVPHSLLDHNNGKYTVTYTIPRGLKLGQPVVHVSVAVNGLPVQSSPFLVSMVSQRTSNAWKRIATFGSEGSQVGQFCRPWGVAIVRLFSKEKASGLEMNGSTATKENLIAVADRSNNRIQLLKLCLKSAATAHHTAGTTPASNNVFGGAWAAGAHSRNSSSSGQNTDAVQLSVVHVFGSGPGTRPGQFDRPSGIAIDVNLGHIIVTDKDNHRVQVFDTSGAYLFKFGEKGSRPGQFCYPWDVCSCSQTSNILVSDTRNRRIQMFSLYGQYLWHCGQPLDSPRGVSFLSADKFLVSDLNKHRLLVIDKTSMSSSSANTCKDDVQPKYIGFGEGSAWGEFRRPQGVVSSGASKIFCADSKNNRISIWNSATQSFDYLAEEVMSLDRPSGLSTVDNLLVVVDFGNNRIQICQR